MQILFAKSFFKDFGEGNHPLVNRELQPLKKTAASEKSGTADP